MASASKTPNLNLPQWVGTEKPERTDFNAAFDAIDDHVADIANKGVLKTYSAIITEPFQQGSVTTIDCGFKPKSVTIDAAILNTKYASTGYITEGKPQLVKYVDGVSETYNITGDRIVMFQREVTSNRLDGIITITETGFVLNWVLTGTLTGVTGNRRYIIQAFA